MLYELVQFSDQIGRRPMSLPAFITLVWNDFAAHKLLDPARDDAGPFDILSLHGQLPPPKQ